MLKKYELATIDSIEVALDLSLFQKTGDLWFNATDVAKAFGKDAYQWLRNSESLEYLRAVLEEYPDLKPESGTGFIKDFGKLVKKVRGRNGGTYLHKYLALAFCRWCSPRFAVKLDHFIIEYIEEQRKCCFARDLARMTYRPMTDAIQKAHNPIKFYHYSTETDMINRIVLGKNAKKLKEEFDIENIRDCMCAQEVLAVEHLQRANTTYIEDGISFEERKEMLTKRYHKHFSLEAMSKPDLIELQVEVTL